MFINIVFVKVDIISIIMYWGEGFFIYIVLYGILGFVFGVYVLCFIWM